MNKWQKEVAQSLLDSEDAAIKALETSYKSALRDINDRIRIFEGEIQQLEQAVNGATEQEATVLKSMQRSKAYQKQYQQALKSQVSAIVDNLQSKEYATIQKYLDESYKTGFVGAMYDMARQGIPVITPINQAAAVKAILTDSKISKGLYSALGIDTAKMKRTITAEITRGISTGMMYNDIARNISNITRAPLSRAKTITRTEGHRIQQAADYDAMKAAKDKGADVVKQWDASLDGDTRKNHRKLDGQIREIDKPFTVGKFKPMFPGDFGNPAEDCNCRCRILQRAKWSLDEDELQVLKERAAYFGLDKSENFTDFKEKYLKSVAKSGKIDSKEVSGQSRQRKESTAKIIQKGIALKQPVFADGNFGKFSKLIQPEDGFYDVALHGTAEYALFFGEKISSQALSKIIKGRTDYNGGAVRLLSCDTGNTTDSENCFAQRLADALNTEVKAPNKLLWVYPDGKIIIGSNARRADGEFVVFKPRRKRR